MKIHIRVGVEEAMTKEVKCGGLLATREYPHLADQSWRKTEHLRLHPKQPKFKGADIERIRDLVASGLSRSAVARMYGATTTTVSNVVDRLGAYKDA